MPVAIRRPSSLDVSRKNPNQILYITGDNDTDGSIRIIFETGADSANIESREDGVWNDTGFRFSSSSLSIGRDMVLSAVSGFLETTNPSAVVGHQRSILPHIEFDDETGTTLNQMHVPITNALETFVLFDTAVSEITGTTIGQIIADSPGRVISLSIHEVGTTAATSQVTVKFFIGTDNSGTLVNLKRLPASDFLANTTLSIDYDDDFGLDAGVDYFMEFTSDNNISLKTDSGGNILTSQVGHELEEINAVTENLIYDENLGHVLDSSLNPVYSNQF